LLGYDGVTESLAVRRRLDLCVSLIGRSPVLLLDEPTAGLDPRTRKELWDTVEELRREGTTVLLTTRYLEEADRLAQRIAVVDPVGSRLRGPHPAAVELLQPSLDDVFFSLTGRRAEYEPNGERSELETS